MLADEAKQRQRAHGGTAPGRPKPQEAGDDAAPDTDVDVPAMTSAVDPEPRPHQGAGQCPPPPRSGPRKMRHRVTSGRARDIAGALTGTSPRYVSDAKSVRLRSPDLHAQVRAGEVTLPEARRTLDRRTAAGPRPTPPSPSPGDAAAPAPEGYLGALGGLTLLRDMVRTTMQELPREFKKWNPVKREDALRRIREVRTELSRLIVHLEDDAAESFGPEAHR